MKNPVTNIKVDLKNMSKSQLIEIIEAMRTQLGIAIDQADDLTNRHIVLKDDLREVRNQRRLLADNLSNALDMVHFLTDRSIRQGMLYQED